jgi:3-isopropylmalate dehydrogenase
MMLNWWDERRGAPVFAEAGATIERAVEACLADPSRRTADLGGSLGCDAFGRAVEAEIARE